MNFQNALKIGELTYKVLTTLHSSGTSMPGKVISKLYPHFLRDVKSYVANELFAVTGTNGKTTTSGILADILKTSGKNVVHNSLGANMPNGIITTIALGLCEYQKKQEPINHLVIESDEAYLQKIFEKLDFDYLLLTNLFPDQTDRYSDPKFTAAKIQEAVALNEKLKLIVNADDPNLDSIGEGREKIYYGFENVELFDSQTKLANESFYCCSCSKMLEYNKRYYSQLGVWSCDCGRTRAGLDISANVKIFKDHSYLDITYEEKNYSFKLKLTGLYNAYNALGAISAALVAGVERKDILEALEKYTPAFGREERIEVDGKKVTVFLIKNPTGARETLRKLEGIKNSKLMFALNDAHADGRDTSWLWDTNFESIGGFDNLVFLTGTRADDAALRLKYAGINQGMMIIDSDIKRALKEALLEVKEDEELTILTSYTALLELNKLLSATTKK